MSNPSSPLGKEVYAVFSIGELQRFIRAIKKSRPNEKGTQLTGVFHGYVSEEHKDSEGRPQAGIFLIAK